MTLKRQQLVFPEISTLQVGVFTPAELLCEEKKIIAIFSHESSELELGIVPSSLSVFFFFQKISP